MPTWEIKERRTSIVTCRVEAETEEEAREAHLSGDPGLSYDEDVIDSTEISITEAQSDG